MLSDAKNNRYGLSIIAVISILVITISCLIYGSRLNKTLGEETNQYLSEIANQSVNVLKKQINGDILKINARRSGYNRKIKRCNRR
ncbi:hypothetical protein LVU73_03620 [Clostridioides difficile]|nr:hypothetical protein [Clostridioides difficile]